MIRARLLAVLTLGCGRAFVDGGFAQSDVDITGTWTGTWESSEDGNSGRFEVQFVQTGQHLSGSIRVTGSPDVRNGTIAGTIQRGRVTFGAVSGGTTVIPFTGTCAARSGNGDDLMGWSDWGPWSAVS